jgi:hypothetical protein
VAVAESDRPSHVNRPVRVRVLDRLDRSLVPSTTGRTATITHRSSQSSTTLTCIRECVKHASDADMHFSKLD